MNRTSVYSRCLIAIAASAVTALAPARADNHALIMWIGDYGNPRANLPGIDLDAANARKIAAAMGVPEQNITEISNADLTRANMAAGLAGVHARIRDGDKVFIYYSGHGGQLPGRGTVARCTEALVARDGLFLDGEMQGALTQLGHKASQVVMMNDSCFSGGAATKTVVAPASGMAPKFLPPDVKTNTAVSAGYSCGDPTNTTKLARSLGAMAKDARGPQVLYIAASNDTQVSFATNKGSLATLAWAGCMGAAHADSDRSGRISGGELAQCAQAWIDSRRAKQTITLQGNPQLPLSFVQPEPAAASAAAAEPAAPATPGAAPLGAAAATAVHAVNAAQALHDLHAAADRGYQVQLTLARASLRIGKDLLDFSVATNRDGYVYILQVGSDGKTFNLLFPNKIDDNNFLSAGTHRFPRDSWRVRAAGPVGTSHLLAIVAPTKKDLSRSMDASGVFPSGAATRAATRTLVVEATAAGEGAAAGGGRYGASAVATLNETP